MDRIVKDRVSYLVDCSLRQAITDEERAELITHLKYANADQDIQEIVLAAYQTEKAYVDMDAATQTQLFNSIVALNQEEGLSSSGKQKSVRKFWYWLSSAAALILFCLIPLLRQTPHIEPIGKDTATIKQDEVVIENIVSHKPHIESDHLPAIQQATLRMFDGRDFVLENLEIGQVVNNGDISVTKSNEGELLITFLKNVGTVGSSLDKNKMNTLVTPRGGIYQVVLGDGTRVKLNASSKLIFPSKFDKDERRVMLEGEGYFEVSKDTNRKFIVATGKNEKAQEVIVYGTKFNVTAYPKDKTTITTLVEGSVKVKQLLRNNERFLEPLEQAVSSVEGMETGEANLDLNLAWINKLFYFHDANVEEVMRQIGYWYDIEVKYVGNTPGIKIWGQVSRTKKLSEVLDVLQQTNDLKFVIKGKEVWVME